MPCSQMHVKCWADWAQMLKKHYWCVQMSLNEWRGVFVPDQLLVVQGFGRLSSNDVHLTLKDRQLHATLHVLLRFINAVTDELTLRTVPEPWESENHSTVVYLTGTMQNNMYINTVFLRLSGRALRQQHKGCGFDSQVTHVLTKI